MIDRPTDPLKRWGVAATILVTLLTMLPVLGEPADDGDGAAIQAADAAEPCEAPAVPSTGEAAGWKREADLRYQRDAGLAAVSGCDGRIYVLGDRTVTQGLSTQITESRPVEVFTPGQGWSELPKLNTPRTDLAAARDGRGRIYVLGGVRRLINPTTRRAETQYLATVEMFDPNDSGKGWQPRKAMPTARAGLAVATAKDGRIFAFGGRGQLSEASLNTVEAYDPEDDQWEATSPAPGSPGLAAMPTARQGFAAATAENGSIYLMGGTLSELRDERSLPVVSDGAESLSTVDIYQPQDGGSPGRWQSGPSMGKPRTWLAAVAVPESAGTKRIYVLGGASNDGWENSVTSYTPGDPKGWRSEDPMLIPRQGLSAAYGSDGRIYAIGGDGPESPAQRVDAYRRGSADTRHPVGCSGGSTPGQWQRLEPLKVQPVDLAMTTGPDARVYAFGGAQAHTANALNLALVCSATGTWVDLAAGGAPLPTPRTALTAASGRGPDGKGRIYVFGGQSTPGRLNTALDVVEAYHPDANRWESSSTNALRPMPRRRVGSAAASFDGRIFLFGGRDESGGYLDAVDVYDPASDTWTEGPSSGPLDAVAGNSGAGPKPLPTPRVGLAAVTGDDGRIYAIGGLDDGDPSAVVEAYDPAANVWSRRAPMAVGRDGFAAAADHYGRIYAISGPKTTADPGNVEFYTPATDLWAEGPDLLFQRRGAAAATDGDGRIYVVGGVGGTAQDLGAVEVLMPKPPRPPRSGPCVISTPRVREREFERTAFPPDFIANAAAPGPDGKIYFFGQSDNFPPRPYRYGVVFAYDPAKDDPNDPSDMVGWERRASIPTPRYSPLAALGPDGLIYVMGGSSLQEPENNTWITQVVEAYDPCTDTWTRAAPMQLVRNSIRPTGPRAGGAAAATGPDGRIYVMGGDATGRGLEALDVMGSKSWSTLPPMSVSRVGVSATTGPDNRIYAIGGNAQHSAEAYNLCTNSWDLVPPLRYNRAYPGIGTGQDGLIRVIAGDGYEPNGLARTPEFFDGRQWSDGRPLPDGADLFSGASAQGSDGATYVVGGTLWAYSPRPVDYEPFPSVCPALSLDDPAPVPESAGSVTFTASLDGPASLPVQVSYETQDKTAKVAEGDYKETRGSLTFLPGEKQKKVTVPVNKDDATEPDETFTLNLKITGTPPGAILKDPQGIATITDPDPATDPNNTAAPTASIGDLVIPEPYTHTAPAVFTLTLSKPAERDLVFSYSTKDGSAQKDLDYRPAQGSVTVLKDKTFATIETTVVGDTLKEPTENYFLDISGGQGAVIEKATGEAKILDAGPGISVGDVSITEGNAGTTPAVFTVVANSPPDTPARARFSTHDAAATKEDDYLEKTETVAFEPGQVAKTVTVDIKADTIPEQDEDFNVSLSEPAGAVLLKAAGKGTIRNDDGPPQSKSLTPIPAAGFAPGSLPPPATINAAQSQAQTSSQAQSQFNAQAQSQAAAQLNQTHTTAPQAQGAIAAEKERAKEFQVEKETGEHASSSKATGYLASSSSQTVPQGAAALAWAGSLFALAAGLLHKSRTQNKDKRTRPAYIREQPPEPPGRAQFRPRHPGK